MDNGDSYIFSNIGKDAGKIYNIKYNKVKSLNKNKKKLRDYFSPDLDWDKKSDSNIIENVDFFKEDNNNVNKNQKSFNISFLKNVLKKNMYNDEEKNKDNDNLKNKNNNKSKNNNNKNIKNKNNDKNKSSSYIKRKKNDCKKNNNIINNKNKDNDNVKNVKNSEKNKNKDKLKKEVNKNNDDFYNNIIKLLIKTNESNLKELKKKKLNRAKSSNNINRYKYYKLHNEKLSKYRELGILQKINEEVQNAIYTPKFDLIYKRIITGPKWNELSGRKQKEIIDCRPASDLSRSKTNNLLFSEGKGVLPMSKQTQRDGFPISNNLRIRYEKKFIPSNSSFSMKTKTKRNNVNHSCHNLKNSKTIYKSKLELENINSLNKCKSIPDFNRYLSRSQVDKILRNNKPDPVNILYPNYNTIEERVKMMVLYNRRLFNLKKKEFRGINPSEFFDANKIFNNLKGNKSSVPEFGKMTSRPYDKILPVYMKGIYSRIVYNEKTDKTLKMNNYSNGQFLDLNNTFNKTSFNKYVNLCLLKSDYIQPEKIKNKSEFKLLSRNFKELDLTKENIGQLLEAKMNKFDKITFKTITHNIKKRKIN